MGSPAPRAVAALVVCVAAALQDVRAPRPFGALRRGGAPLRAAGGGGGAATAEGLRELKPAQGALLVTKWKTQVENDIALGFLPGHTHPDRSVQRIMFVKKAFDRAYADVRSFAAASQAGEAAVATLGGRWPTARVFGNLRNTDARAAAVALVFDDSSGGRDVLHLLVSPDARSPATIAASEAAALAELRGGVAGPTRLHAAAAAALLSDDLGAAPDGADWLSL